jgi:hypothetical protein
MFEQANVQFPDFGYWPGSFSAVATNSPNEFNGPFRPLGDAGGSMEMSGLGNLGLFDSGLDLTGWGLPEYAIAGLAVWGLFAFTGSAKKTVRSVGRSRRSSKRAAAARMRAQAQMMES